MSVALWWERWLQITRGLSAAEVRADATDASVEQVKHLNPGLIVDDHPSRRVADIWADLREAKATGNPADVVIVDHIDQIERDTSRGLSTAESLRETYVELKKMAKDTGSAVVVLHQALRTDDEQAQPRARSSSGPDESSDLVVTVAKAKESEPFDVRAVTTLSRRSAPTRGGLLFNGVTLEMRDV